LTIALAALRRFPDRSGWRQPSSTERAADPLWLFGIAMVALAWVLGKPPPDEQQA
jgi:hypothetical protein